MCPRFLHVVEGGMYTSFRASPADHLWHQQTPIKFHLTLSLSHCFCVCVCTESDSTSDHQRCRGCGFTSEPSSHLHILTLHPSQSSPAHRLHPAGWEHLLPDSPSCSNSQSVPSSSPDTLRVELPSHTRRSTAGSGRGSWGCGFKQSLSHTGSCPRSPQCGRRGQRSHSGDCCRPHPLVREG